MPRIRPPFLTILLGAVPALLGASEAQAHVKWFCAFDVAGRPQGLEQVLCADFEWLVSIALVGLMLGCLAEGTPLGTTLLNGLDRVTAFLRRDTERLVRVTCGFFFVCLWNLGGVILTPELKTDAAWIPWLQLAMAVALVWRQTTPLAALGIVFLFGYGAWTYGAFHLADYPIFLGIAAYLAMTATGRTLYGIRPLDVMRVAASITLMWASVEKWAYPDWTTPLLIAKPGMTLGASPELFMQAAGVIEFTFAFALLWTPLVRRLSAIVLTAVFVSAVFEFGKIDAIGHSGIIAVLLAIAADDLRPAPQRSRSLVMAPACYGAALAIVLTLYYLGHALAYGGLAEVPVI